MTTTIDFSKVQPYDKGDPDYHLAEVKIRVFPPNGLPQTVDAFLDTGAEFSIFARWWAPFFGITYIPGGRAEEIITADGTKHQGYGFDIDIEFLAIRLNIPVVFVPAWAEDEPNPSILGMSGFFDKLVIAFIVWLSTTSCATKGLSTP